eukprot:1360300-Alexandrium_andersonii.AAC.1
MSCSRNRSAAGAAAKPNCSRRCSHMHPQQELRSKLSCASAAAAAELQQELQSKLSRSRSC